jgi:hypothetical protein
VDYGRAHSGSAKAVFELQLFHVFVAGLREKSHEDEQWNGTERHMRS